MFLPTPSIAAVLVLLVGSVLPATPSIRAEGAGAPVTASAPADEPPASVTEVPEPEHGPTTPPPGAATTDGGRRRVVFAASNPWSVPEVLLGGNRVNRPGFYFEPTLITGLEQDDELVQEEIFGPVITVQTFAERGEAVTMANGVRFGLAASVWTEGLESGLQLASALNFGNVWVNTHLAVGPDIAIGGFNESGHGKEGGAAGIEEFTRVKQIGLHTRIGVSDAPASQTA